MASISVMKTTVNDDKPRLQTRLQIPGLHALPKLDPMDDAQSSRLGDNDGVAIKYDPATEGDNQVYVDILTGIKSDYASQDGGPADFSFSSLGDCGQAPYGYDSNSPCVWIRLNKVIDWTPVGYFAPTEEKGFTSQSLSSRMEKDAVYIRCESKEVESGEKTKSTSLTLVAPTETSSPSSTPLKERRLSPSTSSQLSLSKSVTSSPVSTLESTAELSPRISPSMTVTTSDLSPSRSRPAARPSKHPELRKSQLVEASL